LTKPLTWLLRQFKNSSRRSSTASILARYI